MPKPLRAYLEAQADRAEQIFENHGIDAPITGGTVGPQIVRFFIDDVDPEMIKPYTEELAIALRVPSVSVDWMSDERCWALEFENPNPRPIQLLTLLPQVVVDEDGRPDPLPPTTPLLGLTDDGIPLLFRLASKQIRHVLIAGNAGAGKSTLLRDIALTLALTHGRHALKMLMVDGDGAGAMTDVAAAPHVARDPVQDATEAREVLRSLVRHC